MTTIEQAAAAVIALLETSPGLDVFDGDVKARMDSDGRAHPYAVLWVSPGRNDPAEARESDTGRALVWTFQVTAAGGDVPRCRRATQRTLDALLDARPFPNGGLIKLDFDPGPEREDTNVTPSRWYVPLVFTLSLP